MTVSLIHIDQNINTQVPSFTIYNSNPSQLKIVGNYYQILRNFFQVNPSEY